MKNIIATWICIDNKSQGTHFPSAKGNSADASTQEVYWRCVCSFFTTARFTNPDANLVLFSNQKNLPVIEKTDIKKLLETLEVHFYQTPFEYVTPEGYYKEWRNQFYEFSILKFISDHPDFQPDDNFLLLDSDCILTAALTALFESISTKNCITYNIDYKAGQKINGLSRKDMQFIFRELLQEEVDTVPGYYGGELYGSTIAFAKKISADFQLLWKQLLKRHSAGLTYLNEEAHVLSFLFYKNNIASSEANAFIKRLWTDPSTFRNIEPKDAGLPIWHLPAEKTTGFKTFFHWLQSIEFDLNKTGAESFKQHIQQFFMVPSIPARYKPYYAVKKLVKRVASKIS